MDDLTKLDHVSEGQRADMATAGRPPWHAPVIDIVPLKSAENTANSGTDGGNNLTC